MTTDSVPGGLSTTEVLGIPGAVSGTIDSIDMYTGGFDDDWYQVSLAAGMTYQFDMISSTLDGVLTLYDPSGWAWTSVDVSPVGYPESLSFTPDLSNSYYVSVSSYSGATTGSFSLSASITSATGSIDRVGDWYTDVNVGTIAAEGSASGSIDNMYDSDWYAVQLTAGQAYLFGLSSGAPLDTSLDLYDANGTWLDSSWTSAGDESILFAPASTGTYYLAVYGDYSNTGSFTLSSSLSSTTPLIDTVGDWYTDANVGAIAAVGSVSGSIDSSYDSDWYAVQFTAGQSYLLQLSSGTPLDTSLYLYDSNGNWLDGSWSYAADETLLFTAVSSGTYYVAVYGDYANTGGFTLSSSAPSTGATGTDAIPAGTSTAETLAVGQSIAGTINSDTDYGDWYGMSLLANTTYQVDLSAVLFDGQLGLYDADGMFVSWADSGARGDAEALVYTIAQSGTYYIGVASYDGTPGDFQLGLSQVSVSGGTVDNVGGSSATAGSINVPDQVSSAIDDEADTDWFRVTLSADTLYQFDLSSYFIDGTLALYDAYEVQQAYADNGLYVGDPESLFYTPTTAGTYYIEVSGYGSTTGSFQLSTIDYAGRTGDFVVGDASTTATVSMPGTEWGHIDSAASAGVYDSDWYNVRLVAGAIYRVDLSSDATLDGILSLYGMDGASLLTEADLSYQGGSEYFYYSPATTGDYFVAVNGWDTTNGDFWLTVAQISGENTAVDTVGQTIDSSESVTVTATAPGHVNGTINDSADADWYAVALSANTEYQFNLGSLSLDSVLQLYDAQGYELAYVDNTWTAGSEYLVFAPAAAGTYYVGVSSYSDSAGDFLLDIFSAGTVSNVDGVGDSYQTAASGLLDIGGAEVREAVNSEMDEDVYSVALTADTTYLFALSSTALDGLLTLYGADGEWLDSADYGGTGGTENLYFTPLTSGDYYISAGGWFDSTGSYDLSASALTAVGGEVPGDTTSTVILPVPGFVDNQIDSGSDKDWYSLRMSQGAEYSFNLYSNDGTLDGQLQVFDADGNPVYDQYGNGYADDGWYAGDAENLYFTAPTTGDYFVQVSGFGVTTGSYSLYASQAWDDYQNIGSYDDIKWEVIDWWSWDDATWGALSDPISWADVGWAEIVDYSALEWAYVDWTEFDSTNYSELEYEQIDWDELLVDDWSGINWDYIDGSGLNWDQLQYEAEYDPTANYDPLSGWNIDSTLADAAGDIGNDKVLGGVADDVAQLGKGIDYFSGGVGDDNANGGEGCDNLLGGAGNDILNGGAGHDVLEGGEGDDTYYIDSLTDSVTEIGTVQSSALPGFRAALDLSSNIDKVIASVSYTLGNYLENLDLAAGSGGLTGGGNALNNVLTGNEGNNTLTGRAGNDSLDGSTGIDTAAYTGNRASYTISQAGQNFVVTDATGAEGADTVTNIERLTFADAKVALDVSAGNAGTTAKILGAVFGRATVSNPTYVGVGLSMLDGGMSYTDLMALALNAAGATTSGAVVSLLWTNLIGTAPTAAEAEPFVTMLDNGSLGIGALGVLAGDTSVNVSNINLLGLAQTGIEFV